MNYGTSFPQPEFPILPERSASKVANSKKIAFPSEAKLCQIVQAILSGFLCTCTIKTKYSTHLTLSKFVHFTSLN